MSTHKATFPCGHRGKGRFCHLCSNKAQEDRAAEARRQARQTEKKHRHEAWDGFLDPLISQPALWQKGNDLLDQLRQGVHPGQLPGAKRLESNGHWSIPIGSYRLLVDGASLQPLIVLSHEDYNKRV